MLGDAIAVLPSMRDRLEVQEVERSGKQVWRIAAQHGRSPIDSRCESRGVRVGSQLPSKDDERVARYADRLRKSCLGIRPWTSPRGAEYRGAFVAGTLRR